jgi:hypothetical protein
MPFSRDRNLRKCTETVRRDRSVDGMFPARTSVSDGGVAIPPPMIDESVASVKQSPVHALCINFNSFASCNEFGQHQNARLWRNDRLKMGTHK